MNFLRTDKIIIGFLLFGFTFAPTTHVWAAQVLSGHVPAEAKKLQPIDRMPGTNRLHLAIALPLNDTPSLTNLLQDIYNPRSPNYRHFLSVAEFAKKFGASENDVKAVTAFANANGFTVTATHSNRLLVDVEASVSDIEKALHITLYHYQHPREARVFYAPDKEPSLELSTPILHISGLDDFSLPHPRLKYVIQQGNGQTASPNAGSGPGGTYMGADFRAAYAPDTALTGAGQTVGLLQFDGYTASDITYYETHAGLPNVTLTNVLLDGFTGQPTYSGGEVEVSLDIEMCISMAPGLSKVIVYEAGPYGNWHDILSRMASDNLARQLSCSWYIPGGGPDAVADQLFQEMAAQGQSFFNASGDDDAYIGSISFPGDTPYITQVGGTTLSTSGPAGSYVSERVWNWGNGVGSAGGVSTSYAIPGYQTNINMTTNLGSTTMRNTPDVACTADAVYVRADNQDNDVGGTSCAAPLWAGFGALINQAAAAAGRPPVGFINPAVDALCTGPLYSNCFHDITNGDNTSPSSPNKFYACPGYDLCTGWGTPAGQQLINALGNPEALFITPLNGFVSSGGAGGPFTISSQTLTLTNTGTNTLTWTLANTASWLDVSPTSGTLTPGAGAQAVIVSLNAAASNLVVGDYSTTLWFTNLNDNVAQARQYSLSVIAPPMITAQPTNTAVLDGQTASFSVTATGGQPIFYQWLFNGTNLSDGGNILGSASNVLTILNASTNNAGSYSVIVSNVAAVVPGSNAMLSITPSTPVITAQPTNFTVVVGFSAQFSVAAVGSKPFNYQWTFNQTNIPGATNPVLMLTNVQFSQAGAYEVTISNSIGSASSSNATLAVLAAPPCSPPDPALISWWKGESNAYDSIGGNNGTLVGNVTYGPGEVGQGFVFSTNGQGIVVGNNTNLAVQDLSIEGWIRRSSSSIVSQGSGGNGHLFGWGWGGYVFLMNSSGTLVFAQMSNPSYVSGPSVTDTNYHHVGVTKSGANIIFYLDGAAYPVQNQYNVTFVFTNTVGIGFRPDNQDNTFLGTIDEISVYSNAISSAEMQSIYNASYTGKCYTPAPPSITIQPTNEAAVVGTTANFSAAASGTPPLSYQWFYNATNAIVGATNATLILPNVQYSQAGSYAILVTNSIGSALSSNAVLTVSPPPPCVPPAADLISWWRGESNAFDAAGGNNGTLVGGVTYGTGEVGNAFVFSANGEGVLVGNGTNMAVQDLSIECWIQRGSSSIVSSGSGGNGHLFSWGPGGYVFLMNSFGNLVFAQLGNANYLTGPSVTDTNFHHVAVTESGGNVIFYLDGVASPAQSYNATFTFTTSAGIGFRPDNADNTFFGTIDEMSVYSEALSSSDIQGIYNAGPSGKCYVPQPPAITAQPTNATVYAGSTAAFGVAATGAPPLAYQWIFNATNNIPGATNSTLVLTNVQMNQAGDYSVSVSNSIGSAISSNAVLTVLSAPPCSPPDASLISWWKAENNAYDVAGGNDGTLVGGVTYGTGEVGDGFVFNANGQGISIGSGTSLQVQNLTIEAWIQRTSSSIVSSGSGGNGHLFSWGPGGYVLLMGPSGTLEFAQLGNPGYVSGPSVVDTNFHHVAVTKSGGNITFYLDGVAFPAPSYSATFTFTSSAGIGFRPDNADNTFLGTIDEMSIYSNALSSAEIQSIYDAGYVGKCYVPQPPAITAQPSDQVAVAGSTVSFAVMVTGAKPFAYQWFFNATNTIPGATNATLTLNNVQTNQGGAYAVLVSNIAGSALSSNAVLTVVTAPPCLSPVSNLVSWWAGQGDSLDSAGTNNGTLVGGAGYGTGEVGEGFVFTNNGQGVLVGNGAGMQVQNLTIECWVRRTSSSTVSFGSGGNGHLFSWGLGGYVFLMNSSGQLVFAQLGNAAYVTGPSVTDTNFHHIAFTKSGSTITFYLDGVASVQSYNATFTFTTSAGIGFRPDNSDNSFLGIIDELSLYSRALSSAEIQAIYNAGNAGKCPLSPEFYLQPAAQTVVSGTNVTLSAAATGTPFLSYQWVLNGTNVPGATNTSLALLDVQLTNGGSYVLTAANSAGSAASSNALLTIVRRDPKIISEPTNQTVYAGGTAVFSVSAYGSLPLTYQWMFNGTNLSGATNSVLTLTNVGLIQAGEYAVTVGNPVFFTQSTPAFLTIVSPPQCSPPASGLVGWWKAENSAFDVVGTNNGTLVSGATYGPGEVGQGFLLNGHGQGVLLGTAPSLQLQSFTIEFWIRRGSSSTVSFGSGGNGHLFSWGPGGYVLLLNSSGSLIFAQLGNVSYLTGPSITDTNLHHVALTESGGTVKFYLDGTLGSTASYNVTYSFTSSVGIGYRPDNGDNGFWGTIDEMSVYNRALSSTEVAAVYNAGANGKCAPLPDIISQPASILTTQGCTESFNVLAGGASQLGYQWWKDSAVLSGRTNSTLSLTNIQPTNFGTYWVVVSSPYGATVSSSNALLALDHLPVPGPDSIQRFSAGGVRVPAASLLTNDTDADGDPLAIISVSTNSAAGGVVYMQSNWVYYLPPANNTNYDTYNYIVSDGHCGGISTGTVTVQIKPDNSPTGTFNIQTQAGGSKLLIFDGFPGRTYRIQFASNLVAPIWQDLSTNTSDIFGTILFSDPATNAPTRYYRAVSP